MTSNIEPIVVNGHNYAIWVPYMETLLESKGLWKYTKVVIPDPTNVDAKFIINRKKDKVVGLITTYISREIHFHTSDINCPHVIWNKLQSLLCR